MVSTDNTSACQSLAAAVQLEDRLLEWSYVAASTNLGWYVFGMSSMLPYFFFWPLGVASAASISEATSLASFACSRDPGLREQYTNVRSHHIIQDLPKCSCKEEINGSRGLLAMHAVHCKEGL